MGSQYCPFFCDIEDFFESDYDFSVEAVVSRCGSVTLGENNNQSFSNTLVPLRYYGEAKGKKRYDHSREFFRIRG